MNYIKENKETSSWKQLEVSFVTGQKEHYMV